MLSKETYTKLLESVKGESLYRNTAIEWLTLLLRNGWSESFEHDFLSFSKDKSSGNLDFSYSDGYNFGNITVEFDPVPIYLQGARDVEYTPEFFKKHPNIAEHITKFSSEEDYMENRDDETKSWADFIKGYSNEREVVIKRMRLVPGMIRSVTIWPDDDYDPAFIESQVKDIVKAGISVVRKDI